VSGPPRTTPLRVAVLASGRGSNLQAIVDAIESKVLQAQIIAVISNKKESVALDRARKHGLPDLFVDPKPFAGQADSREAYDRALLDVLEQRFSGVRTGRDGEAALARSGPVHP